MRWDSSAMWWIGQQLDRGDAERGEVLDRRLRRQAGVGAAQVLADVLVAAGEALHVQLVDDGLVPRPARRRSSSQSKRSSTTTHFGIASASSSSSAKRSASLAVGDVGKGVGGAVDDRALDRLRVRVDQELGRVEAFARLRLVRSVDAVAVALPRPDPGR